MTRREKILTGFTGAAVAIVLGFVLVQKLLLGPSAKLDEDALDLRKKIGELRLEHVRANGEVIDIRNLMRRTYADDEIAVGEAVRERMMGLLARAGLSSEGMTLQPIRGKVKRGVYREVGRLVSVRGKLSHVVNFLYLLAQDPHLHRVDNLTLTRDDDGDFKLQLRYLTLVIDEPEGRAIAVERPTSQPVASVTAPERELYDVIVERDLFRPYVKKPPTPVRVKPVHVATPKQPDRTPPAKPTAPPDSRFKIVDLTDWSGEAEVAVLNTQTNRTERHKIGDELAGGKIAKIDYRTLMLPGEPPRVSHSRVIVRIGADYWAIELGQTLAEKRVLKPAQLPDDLQDAPAATDAAAGADNTTPSPHRES